MTSHDKMWFKNWKFSFRNSLWLVLGTTAYVHVYTWICDNLSQLIFAFMGRAYYNTALTGTHLCYWVGRSNSTQSWVWMGFTQVPQSIIFGCDNIIMNYEIICHRIAHLFPLMPTRHWTSGPPSKRPHLMLGIVCTIVLTRVFIFFCFIFYQTIF